MKVYIISHIASGAFMAGKSERDMQENVASMIGALATEA